MLVAKTDLYLHFHIYITFTFSSSYLFLFKIGDYNIGKDNITNTPTFNTFIRISIENL